MNTYFNSTRIAAIVTLKIESVEDPNVALVIAEHEEKDVLAPIAAKPGYLDVEVAPGKELRVKGNTVVTFVGVRSA